jgi:hypothetical protein
MYNTFYMYIYAYVLYDTHRMKDTQPYVLQIVLQYLTVKDLQKFRKGRALQKGGRTLEAKLFRYFWVSNLRVLLIFNGKFQARMGVGLGHASWFPSRSTTVLLDKITSV